MKTCYIYVRTATTPQVFDRQNVAPIVNQLQTCVNYALQNKYQVLKIFEDIGISGNTFSRPGLGELFEACKETSVDALIVASIDSTARSCSTFLLIKNKLKSFGVLIINTQGEIL
jgi:DNA invertase Pin-like site-specific DNA recombinase